MSRVRYGPCGTCHRRVPLRRDGRLRAHLAARGGQREGCAGSGAYSAYVVLLGGEAGRPDVPPCSAAAAGAVRAEWELADALWREYQDMTRLWACSQEAADSAYEAVERALARARQLEAQYPGWAYADAG